MFKANGLAYLLDKIRTYGFGKSETAGQIGE